MLTFKTLLDSAELDILSAKLNCEMEYEELSEDLDDDIKMIKARALDDGLYILDDAIEAFQKAKKLIIGLEQIGVIKY